MVSGADSLELEEEEQGNHIERGETLIYQDMIPYFPFCSILRNVDEPTDSIVPAISNL